ncbi:MAG: S-layer homology domain-containing protein, partial [Ruminococcaceae bacterium]|nr:S-layer homology domain-containing protein [Oscillospiraceae bacterium]
VAAKGHTWESATCTKPKTCKTCGVTDGSAKGHSFGNWSVTKQPTCTEKGQEKRTCSSCGHAETRDVAAKGHTWESATCTKPKTCKTCGVTDGSAKGHSFGNWSVTKQPTCTEKGQEKRTCSSCGHAETRDVAAKGHDWTAANCTEPRTCKVCGTTEGSVGGHDWIAATCTTPKTCQTCGTTDGNALGHSFGEWTVTRGSTCAKEGEKERVCSACGHVETVSFGGTCPSAGFTDISQDAWYHESVDYVTANNLMQGVGNNAFSPQGQLTRAQLVTVLYRMENQPDIGGLKNPFSDVPAGTWYTDAVVWAASEGIVKGTSLTSFAPNAQITREQIATILYRYAQYKDYATSATADLSDYTDGHTASDWARDALGWCVSNGILNGMGDGTMNPRGNATRAQIAKIIFCFYTEIAG